MGQTGWFIYKICLCHSGSRSIIPTSVQPESLQYGYPSKGKKPWKMRNFLVLKWPQISAAVSGKSLYLLVIHVAGAFAFCLVRYNSIRSSGIGSYTSRRNVKTLIKFCLWTHLLIHISPVKRMTTPTPTAIQIMINTDSPTIKTKRYNYNNNSRNSNPGLSQDIARIY